MVEVVARRPDLAPVLEMRNISKTFPGVKALQNVQLTIYPGEVHALMGENGAGKSTLMKTLSGAYQADPGGEILIEGKPVKVNGPIEAREAGVSIIYQELALAPNLSVAENIYLNREPGKSGLIDRAAMNEGSKGVLQRLGASFTPQTLVGSLSIAERQMVEIARAVHANSRILVMDEPTTALSSRESDNCSISCDNCAAMGSPSSTFRTAWPRSTSCRTACRCCATAPMWAPSCGTR